MRTFINSAGHKILIGALPFALGIATIGCSSSPKFADAKAPVHDAITQAGFKDVSVDQDRDKGVIP